MNKLRNLVRRRERLPPKIFCILYYESLPRSLRREVYFAAIEGYRIHTKKEGEAAAITSFALTSLDERWKSLPEPLKRVLIAIIVKTILGN